MFLFYIYVIIILNWNYKGDEFFVNKILKSLFLLCIILYFNGFNSGILFFMLILPLFYIGDPWYSRFIKKNKNIKECTEER